MATRTLVVLCISALASGRAPGQGKLDMTGVREVPVVTGHELTLSKELMEELKEFHPQTDNLGNVWVTFGNGVPHRLIAAPVDEPGYITDRESCVAAEGTETTWGGVSLRISEQSRTRRSGSDRRRGCGRLVAGDRRSRRERGPRRS